MKEIKPKVFLIGETKINNDGLDAYLNYIGVPKWKSDAKSDIEKLIEVNGRLCYRSFEIGQNPNIIKIRKENKKYIRNIIKSEHGSVLEHAYVNFIFADVSRVFTHELVRHRVGTAVSQESLRYVRLDKLKAWAPTVITENDNVFEIFVDSMENFESLQADLADAFDIDNDASFISKKQKTSSMRRLAPMGLATTVGWSANIRTIRHVLEMRTSRHAEEEIRLVFEEVGTIMQKKYPAIFSDYKTGKIDGIKEFATEFKKV